MSDAMFEAVAAQFRALGEPARLRILSRLLEGEATVGELAATFGWSVANASKHAALLAAEGFLLRRREGATVVCSVADPVVARLCDLMCGRATERAARGLAAVRGA